MLKVFLSEKARSAGVQFKAPRALDAGFDIACAKAYQIQPGEIVKIETGLHVAINEGWVGIIKDRSSVGSKGGHCLAGVIDASYRGECLVVMKNLGSNPLAFEPGDRIAQMVIIPHHCAKEVLEVNSLDELGDTERGQGGFGSTGA